MKNASQVSSSLENDSPVNHSSEPPAPFLSDAQLEPKSNLKVEFLAKLKEMLFSWFSLSLSLFILDFVNVLTSGSQYWMTLALSQWGVMAMLSLGVVMILQVLRGSLKQSWPHFITSSWPQKLIMISLFLMSLLSIILLTQQSVEWTSKQFRQVSYRGLFTGLVAALVFVLNVLFMPLLARLLMSLGHLIFSKLPPKLVRGNAKSEVDHEPSLKNINPRDLLKPVSFIMISFLVYYADQISVWSLPKLETVDLRSISILLNGLWLSLLTLGLCKFFSQDKQIPGSNPQHLTTSHYLLLIFMCLSMWMGLSNAYHLSPEQWLKLERDSALSSVVIKKLQQQSDQDQDGMAAHWGGGDCNDHDPKQRHGIIDQKRKDLNCNGVVRLSSHPFMPLQKASLNKLQIPMERASPQNIILLTIDALRYDAFREDMPFTQEFAKKAVDFTKAYSAGAATYWSVPALLGSRPPSYFEMGRDQTPVNRERLLTESLRDSAFHTALFANVTIFFVRGLSQGAYTKNYDTSRHTVHGAKPGAAHLTNGLLQHIDLFQAGKLKPKRDRFFLWGHYYDPHDPYFEVQSHRAKDQSSHARYRAIVRSVDHELNRLYQALDSRGLLENTMVILTADHGDEFFDHNHRFHGKTLYDEMVKVPLLIYSPQYQAQQVEQVVSHLDIAPTVLEHLGLRAEKRFMGSNHDLALRLGKALNKDEAFFEVLPDQNYSRHLIGLRLGDEKMIYSLHQGAIEHYNLVDDPKEKLNLFSRQDAYKNQQIYKKLMRYVEAQLYTLAKGKAGVRLPKAR
ncbi:MAG: hypothetical protein CMH49_04270 [Myxococcales bacterium]|nr:hypothetical protein [Myxococcales bacterium]